MLLFSVRTEEFLPPVTAPTSAIPASSASSLLATSTGAGSVPGAIAANPPAGSAFPALLLATRAAAGDPTGAGPAAGVPVTDPAEFAPDTLAAAPTFTPLSLPAGAAPLLGVPAGTGKVPDETLPATGTDLPPEDLDVETLLASLVLPGATSLDAATTPPATPTRPAGASDATLPTLTDAGSQPSGQAARAAPEPPSNQQSAPTESSVTDAAWLDPITLDKTTAEATATSGDSSREAPAGSPTQRGMDLGLPAEFRARLEAMLNAAQRPASGTDGGTLALGGLATATSPGNTASTTSSAANAVDTLFEGLPRLEPLSDRQAMAQNLGDRLLMMADKGLQSATLRLQPEHLGHMEIRIRVNDDGSAQVVFSAPHAHTRDALENAIPRLRELFADQGLSLTQASVDSGRGAFGQRGHAANLPAWLHWNGGPPETALVRESVWRVSRHSERRLDVLV
jgi:flagellar hook-length control protein FliK